MTALLIAMLFGFVIGFVVGAYQQEQGMLELLMAKTIGKEEK